MSNNPNEPDNQDDGFQEERLASARHFREARKKTGESFTSFSDGMPAVDKFKILGATGEHAAVQKPKKKSERQISSAGTGVQSEKKRSVMRSDKEQFTSFSEGLPSADKFSIDDHDCGLTGQKIIVSLNQFIEDDRYPLINEHASASRNPHENELGNSDFRSKSLERLMFLLATVPWKDDLKIEFSGKPEFREYCFDEGTMMLSSAYDEEQTVLAFAHQSYHATNRLLTKLYDDDQPLDRETFVDLHMWAEVAALITEINVRRELGLWKVAPPKVLCQESDGSLFSINVEDLLKNKGMKTLHDLLFFTMLRGSERVRLCDVYEKLFEVYELNFESEKDIAKAQIESCLSQGIERDCI